MLVEAKGCGIEVTKNGMPQHAHRTPCPRSVNEKLMKRAIRKGEHKSDKIT